jgi:hypothetical protein
MLENILHTKEEEESNLNSIRARNECNQLRKILDRVKKTSGEMLF